MTIFIYCTFLIYLSMLAFINNISLLYFIAFYYCENKESVHDYNKNNFTNFFWRLKISKTSEKYGVF